MNDKSSQPPTQEETALAAYAIWEREGRPHGRDVTHWIQAEQQLLLAPPIATATADASQTRSAPLAAPGRRRSKANRGVRDMDSVA